jgi:hypothetical protein
LSDELRDSYRLLELDAGSSPEAVKRSYRDLVKLWHPDRYSPGSPLQKKAEEKLKEINLAYERIFKRPPGGIAEEPPPKSAHAAPAMAEETSGHKRPWPNGDPETRGGRRPAPKQPAAERGNAARMPPVTRLSFWLRARWHQLRPWPRRARMGIAVALLAAALVAWALRRQSAHPSDGAPSAAAAKPAATPVAADSAPRSASAPPEPAARPAAMISSTPAAPNSAAVQIGSPPRPASPRAALPAEVQAPPGAARTEPGALPPAATHLGTFAVGSTKAEVIAVQGAPDSFTNTIFQYGSSVVIFRNDRVDSWQEGTPALKVRVASPEADAPIGYFTVGSTKAEVIGVQGRPDSFTANAYQYGSSTVVFRNDRVESWREGSARLRARAPEMLPSAHLDHFTRGSTRSEVIAAQGKPDGISANAYQYGSSLVLFDHDRVISWQNGSPPLRARMLPILPAKAIGSFTIGSSKDDVVAVQGLPDRFTAAQFQYGTSTVDFTDDKVTGWQAGSPPLKVRRPEADSAGAGGPDPSGPAPVPAR